MEVGGSREVAGMTLVEFERDFVGFGAGVDLEDVGGGRVETVVKAESA